MSMLQSRTSSHKLPSQLTIPPGIQKHTSAFQTDLVVTGLTSAHRENVLEQRREVSSEAHALKPSNEAHALKASRGSDVGVQIGFCVSCAVMVIIFAVLVWWLYFADSVLEDDGAEKSKLGGPSKAESEDTEDSASTSGTHAGGCLLVVAAFWSIALGASVAACGVFNYHLNAHVPPAKSELHAIYTSTLALTAGGVLVLPVWFAKGIKIKGRPSRWYSPLGGVAIVLEFLTIPSFEHLGVQIVLLLMLLGMLFTGMAFDLRAGEFNTNRKRRILGFVIVMAGVVIDYFGPAWFGSAEGSDDGFDSSSIIYVLFSFLCGVGYCLMAKCNTQLKADIGSTYAATIVCAVVAVLARMPLMFWVGFGKGIWPTYAAADWYWWVAAGGQSAFYNFSLAVVPSMLGYTTNYIVMLIGKLGGSSVIDALGWGGHVVPLDLARGLGVSLVLVGSIIFTVKSWRSLRPGAKGPSADETGKGVATDDDDSSTVDFDMMVEPQPAPMHP